MTTPTKKENCMEEKQQSRRLMCENNAEAPRIQVVLQHEKPDNNEEKIKETPSYETKKANEIKNNDNLNEYDELKVSQNVLNANKIACREKPDKAIEDEIDSINYLSCNEQKLRETIQSLEAATGNEHHPFNHAKDDNIEITKKLDVGTDNNQGVVNDIQKKIKEKGQQQVLNVVSKINIDNSPTSYIIPSSNQSSTQIECEVSVSSLCIKQKLCTFCKKSFVFNFQLKKHKFESCKPFLVLEKRYKRTFFRKNICEKCGLKFRNPISLSTHRAVCCKFSKMEKKDILRDLRSNMNNEKKYRKRQTNDKKIKNKMCPSDSRGRKSGKNSGNNNLEKRKIELRPQKIDLNPKSGLFHNAETIKGGSHLTNNNKIGSTNELKSKNTTEKENPNLSGNKLNSEKFETTNNLENGTNCKNKSISTSNPSKIPKINPVNNSQKSCCDQIIPISNSSSNSKYDLSGTKTYLKSPQKLPIGQVSTKKTTKIETNTDFKGISDSTSDSKSSKTDKALKTTSADVNKFIDDKTHCVSDKNTEQKLNVCNKNQNQKATDPDVDYYFRSRICDICYFRFDNINALTRHQSLYCKRFNIQTKLVSTLCSESSSKCQKNDTGNLNLIRHNSGGNRDAIGSPNLSKKVGENQLTSLKGKGDKEYFNEEAKISEITIQKLQCQSKVSSNNVKGNSSLENNKNQMLQTNEKEFSQLCGDLTKPKNAIKVPKKISKAECVVPNTVCNQCKTNFRCKVDLIYHKDNFCKKNIPEMKHIEPKIALFNKMEIKEKNEAEESKCSKVNDTKIKSNKLHTEVTKAKSSNISEQADTPKKDFLQIAACGQDKEEPKKTVDQSKKVSQDNTSQLVLNDDGKICYRCGSEFYYNSALRRHQSWYCRIFKKTTENIKKNDKGNIDKGVQQNDKINKSISDEKLESVANASKKVSLKEDLKETVAHIQPYISTRDHSNNKVQNNIIHSSKIVTDIDKKSINNKSLSGDIPHNISADANTKLVLTRANIETTRNLDIQQKTSEKTTKIDMIKKVVSKSEASVDFIIDEKISPKMSEKKTDQLKNANNDIARAHKEASSIVSEKTECKNDKIGKEPKISEASNKSDATVSKTVNKSINTPEKQHDISTETNIRWVVKTENIKITMKSPDMHLDQINMKIDTDKKVACKSGASVVFINDEKMSPKILQKTHQLKNPNVDIAKTYKEISSISTEKIECKNENFKRSDEKKRDVTLTSENSESEILMDSNKDHTIICRSTKISKNISKNAEDMKTEEENLKFSGTSPIQLKAAPSVILENKTPAKEGNNNDNVNEIQKKIEITEDKDAFNNEIPGAQDVVKKAAKQTITAPKTDHAEDNNICSVCGYQFEYLFALKRHTSLYCKAFNKSNSKINNKDLDTKNTKTKLDKTASPSKEINKINTSVNSEQKEDSQHDLNKHFLEKDEDSNKTNNAEIIILDFSEDDEEIEMEPEEGPHLQHGIIFDLREKLNKKSDLRKKIKTKKENEPNSITKEKSHHKVPDTKLNEGGLSQNISASTVINAKEKISSKHVIVDLTGKKKNYVLPDSVASTYPSTIVKSTLKEKIKKPTNCNKSPAKPKYVMNKARIEKEIKIPSPTINPTATRVYNKVATFDAVEEPKIFCEKCGQTIRTINDLENPPCGHRTIFFECLVCETDFSNINSLINHQNQMHQAAEIVIKEAEDKKNYSNCYYCCHCGEGFKFLTHIISHKANKHQFYKKSNNNSPVSIIKPDEQEEQVYRCVFCNDKPFTYLENLLRHEETSKDHKQNERKFPNLKANYSPKKFEHVCYICNIGFRSFKKHQIHMLRSYQHHALLEKKNLKNNSSSENIERSPSVKIVGLETNLEPKKTITEQQYNISYHPQVIEHVPSTSYYLLQTPLPSQAYSTVYPVENLPSHYFVPNQSAHFYDQQHQKQYFYQNQEQSYPPSQLYQPRPLEKPSEYTRSRAHSSDDYYSKSIPIHIPSVVNKNPLSKTIKNYSTPVSIEKSDLYKKIVGALNPDLQITTTIEPNIEYSKSLSTPSQLPTISKAITKPTVKTTSSTKQTSISNQIYSAKEVVSSRNLTSASNPDYQVAYTVPPKPVTTTSEPILVSDDPLELDKPFIRYYDIQKHAILSYNEFETKERSKPEENKKESDDGQMDALDIYSETSVTSDSKVQFKGHKCYGCDETFNELRELNNHECSGPF